MTNEANSDEIKITATSLNSPNNNVSAEASNVVKDGTIFTRHCSSFDEEISSTINVSDVLIEEIEADEKVSQRLDSEKLTILEAQPELQRDNSSIGDGESETGKEKLGNHKAGSTFTSILSVFQDIKSGKEDDTLMKNGEKKIDVDGSALSYQNNFLRNRLSCCLFATPNGKEEIRIKYEDEIKIPNNATIVSTSPKPEKISFQFSNLNPLTEDLTNKRTSEQISLVRGIFHQENSFNDGLAQSVMSNIPVPSIVNSSKLKLITEGDVSMCFQYHSKTVISKVLTLKFLRRWETHHIYLQEDSISSKTPNGMLESRVSYSNIEDVYVIGRDQGNKLYIQLACNEGCIIMQANNSFARDQWLLSILWMKKMHNCKNILQSSTRSEVILKEIKSLITSTHDSPLQDDSIVNVPVQIISNVLMQNEIWQDCRRREEVIIALLPLLEKITPSAEMFQFFSQHCLLHPRSRVISDVFTSVVHRILKRTFDFGKSPYMRNFAADYMTALHCQNGGNESIKKFLESLHGPTSECPHPRVLKNLVAVNLAAILSIFEKKRMLINESANEENCSIALQQLDCQLNSHLTVFRAISEYEDWRPGLAQLLQPIPFPDDALSYEFFVDGFTPVIRSIGMDPRCEVHEMILGVREEKGGWLNIYCPSGLVSRDEGELWCCMLETLISCCCRRKSFLQKLMKHLGALILVSLRGHNVAQEILCLMLEWNIICGEDQELQVITALESTDSGREKYSELCKRQEHLRQLQRKRGPRKLTLPSRSTDVDVAQLLSSGSFGNLECLSLAFTHVTSSCAHQLIQLPTLRCLNLWATHFGDAGLVIIAEHLDKLQVLNLCETPVTDKGISALTGMKNLRKLNLNSTKLSPQTLETLKQKLPALQELDVRYTDAW